MRTPVVLAMLALPVSLTGQEPADHPSVTLPPALERILRDYEHAWAAGNADSLARLFTADGMVMSSREGPIQGRDGIRSYYRGAAGDLRLRAIGYSAGDTVGYILGAYRYGEAVEDRGMFVLALRRVPGGPWLIAADMDKAVSR